MSLNCIVAGVDENIFLVDDVPLLYISQRLMMPACTPILKAQYLSVEDFLASR